MGLVAILPARSSACLWSRQEAPSKLDSLPSRIQPLYRATSLACDTPVDLASIEEEAGEIVRFVVPNLGTITILAHFSEGCTAVRNRSDGVSVLPPSPAVRPPMHVRSQAEQAAPGPAQRRRRSS